MTLVFRKEGSVFHLVADRQKRPGYSDLHRQSERREGRCQSSYPGASKDSMDGRDIKLECPTVRYGKSLSQALPGSDSSERRCDNASEEGCAGRYSRRFSLRTVTRMIMKTKIQAGSTVTQANTPPRITTPISHGRQNNKVKNKPTTT